MIITIKEVINIKILTLNSHSLIEPNYDDKLNIFIDTINQLQPDIIALQEVNQSVDGKKILNSDLLDYYPCQDEISIHEDNHAYSVVKRLYELNTKYYWTWLPIKVGYIKFIEGLAILSLKPIIEVDTFLISNINDYYNWRTRKTLGIKLDTCEWFYNTHMSWWHDFNEPFKLQWERLNHHLKDKSKVWLMGDFNNSPEVQNEGYSLMEKSNWLDTYQLANVKDNGITVSSPIDGWKDKTFNHGLRIDQIWCNFKTTINSSEVIFNGINRAVVSDHYGVLISTS